MKSTLCPICGNLMPRHPALSRTDNKTSICSDCGTLEAFIDAGIVHIRDNRPLAKTERRITADMTIAELNEFFGIKTK